MVRRAAVFLAIGAAVNVLVAMACVCLNEMLGFGPEEIHAVSGSEGEPYWTVHLQSRSPGFTRGSVIYGGGSQSMGGGGWVFLEFAKPRDSAVPELPPGETLAEGSPELQRRLQDLYAGAAAPSDETEPSRTHAQSPMSDRAGWPMRSLGCWYVGVTGNPGGMVTATGNVTVARGIKIRAGWPPAGNGLRAIPLWPLWPGFAVNTALYAALAWAAWRGTGIVRSRRWSAHGRCAGCGYEVGMLERCPECGLDRRAPRAA